MTDSGEGPVGDLFGGPEIGPAPEGGWGEGAPVAVLVPIPVDRTLDYLAPFGGCAPGDWLEVEVGPRVVLGICWGPAMSPGRNCAPPCAGWTCRPCPTRCAPSWSGPPTTP